VRPADGTEVPAQRWIDLSQRDYGVSLLNDCRYAFDVSGNTLRMTVLRGISDLDPRADEGEHELRYALYPHAGGWREAHTVRRGWETNLPLLARQEMHRSGVVAPWTSAGALGPLSPTFRFPGRLAGERGPHRAQVDEEEWGQGSPIIVRLPGDGRA
jgi:hypothetical protein